MPHELGIIGAGNMAEAIARGLLKSNALKADQMIACDVTDARRQLFVTQLGIQCVTEPVEPSKANTILLAVKPQQMNQVLESLAANANPKALIVSIAAGVTTKAIEKHLSPRPVVRVMPNTPLMVGQGATALAPGTYATAEHLIIAKCLFSAGSIVVEVTEDQLDAVTALSGSGPAYVFFLVEQMIKAGVDMGLSPEVSKKLATQTIFGAATMLTQSSDEPELLRRKVTSPGGTTQAAIEYLQTNQVDAHIVMALIAAQRRGRELGAT